MPVNKEWPRWIFASICKHFDARKQGISMYVEGQLRLVDDLQEFFELRIDGPNLTEVSHKYWKLYLEVNVLIQSIKDDADFHRDQRLCGIIASAFTDIPLFKYGGSSVDDGTESLGCLTLLQDARSKEKITISHFGQIEPNTNLIQSTVEGHYEMFLDE
jgi:hypothetical protein